MGLIQLEKMEFYAYHGHFKEEQIAGNRFLVNLTIDADLNKPAVSDNLEDAINYQRIYELVSIEMKKKSHLLENIAKRITDAIYEHHKTIKAITVKISKINPPVGGKMNKISITYSA